MTKYERNYVKWYLCENKNKLLLTLGILFLAMPLFAIMTPSMKTESDFRAALIFPNLLMVICTSALAYGMALYNFRYLMKKGIVVMHMAMPIKKSHLFILNYVLGAMVVVFFPLLMYVFAALVDQGLRAEFGIFLFVGVCISLLGFILYTFYIFIIVKCHNFWDACLICLAYTVLPVLLIAGLEKMLNSTLRVNVVSMNYQVSEIISFTHFLELCSPIAVMFALAAGLNNAQYEVGSVMNSNDSPIELWDALNRVEEVNFAYVVFWIVLGIFFFFLARRIHEKRKSEASEQRTTAYLCYPFLSLLVASSFMMVSTDTFAMGRGVDIQLPFTMIIVALIVYLVMNFFAKRKIQVTKSMVFSFAGVVVAVYALNYVCAVTAGFNLINEYPSFSKIESAYVRFDIDLMSYTEERLSFDFKNPRYERFEDAKLMMISVEEPINDETILQEVYDLQKMFVEENANLKYVSVDYNPGYVYIDYRMDNKKDITRQYTITDQKQLDIVKELFERLVDKGYCGSPSDFESNIYTNIENMQ